MSLIACTEPCVYQKDGRCTLSRAASPGGCGHRGCVNFVPVLSQQRGHGLSDVGYPNQLQTGRSTQLPLDSSGNQALSEP